MTSRRPAVAIAGLVALLAGVVALPSEPLAHMVSPALACAVAGGLLVVWPRSRGGIPAAAVVVAAVSISVTGWFLATGGGDPRQTQVPTTLWMLLEPAALPVLVYLALRWCPPRTALSAAGLVGLAAALSVQRYAQSGRLWEQVAASAMWLIPSLVAGLVAWYLRGLEADRRRAVEDARRRQRLDLAGDLHDFVAHDVSEIVAQAQAGRMVLGGSDPRVDELLERIEAAGLRALTSMDHTVHMLHDPGRSPTGGLTDLPEVAARFDAVGPATVSLDMPDVEGVGRETGAVAHRIVVEALTNVRRHAPQATAVELALHCGEDLLLVTVTDDGSGDSPPRSRGDSGLGLPGLTERVEALGGSLEAGPHSPRGWRLTARLPLANNRIKERQ